MTKKIIPSEKSRAHPWVSGIVAAAGMGTRMGPLVNKQRVELGGKAILAHTIEKLCDTGLLSECIVVVPSGETESFKRLVNGHIKDCDLALKFVEGGKDRADSIRNGLEALDDSCEFVLIHDGVRPFVTVSCVAAAIEKAIEAGACVVAVPVKDTIKIVDSEGVIESTPDRNKLYHIQTPQVFRRDWIETAYKTGLETGAEATDDSGLVERLGHAVHIVKGSYYNLKITTPEDLVFANNILENEQKKSAKKIHHQTVGGISL